MIKTLFLWQKSIFTIPQFALASVTISHIYFSYWLGCSLSGLCMTMNSYPSIYLSNYLAKELAVCLSICLFFESHYKWDFLVKSCLIPQPQADLVASSSLFPVLILIPVMLLFLLPSSFYLILTLISVVYAQDIEYQTHINTYHHNNIIKQKLLFIYDMWYAAHLLVEEWRWLDHALTNCIVCTEQINPD